LFAITMMAQPLAWFEATGLPAEAFQTGKLIQTYQTVQTHLHGGQIFPIGDEPNGKGWTGFQSIITDKDGFLLIFREDTPNSQQAIRTWFSADQRVRLQPVAGSGKGIESIVTVDGRLSVTLPAPNSFGLYRYTVVREGR